MRDEPPLFSYRSPEELFGDHGLRQHAVEVGIYLHQVEQSADRIGCRGETEGTTIVQQEVERKSSRDQHAIWPHQHQQDRQQHGDSYVRRDEREEAESYEESIESGLQSAGCAQCRGRRGSIEESRYQGGDNSIRNQLGFAVFCRGYRHHHQRKTYCRQRIQQHPSLAQQQKRSLGIRASKPMRRRMTTIARWRPERARRRCNNSRRHERCSRTPAARSCRRHRKGPNDKSTVAAPAQCQRPAVPPGISIGMESTASGEATGASGLPTHPARDLQDGSADQLQVETK